MPKTFSGNGWRSRITTLLGTRFPIVLGPMRMITLGKMAAAVSAAGGFGIIAASGLSNDQLRAELKAAAELTDMPVGVNIPVYRPNASDALEIAIEMGVQTVYTAAGNPAKLMSRIKEAGLKVIHKVSDEKMAVKAQSAGADAVVAMGFEAGGHVGREQITTMCLIPRLANILTIPVIASGGIGDAGSVAAAIALGAEGVEMGTRFVATMECPAPDFFKQHIVAGGLDATLLLGKEAMPIRVLKNRVTRRVAGMEDETADAAIETEGDAQYVMAGGNEHTAVMPCGQIAGSIGRVEAIADVFSELSSQMESTVARLNGFFRGGGHEV
jgi:enoyl-[acyl-carrier protein] reductase II